MNFARSKAKQDLKLSATSGINDCQIALQSGPATLTQHSRLLVCTAVIGKSLIYVEIRRVVWSSPFGDSLGRLGCVAKRGEVNSPGRLSGVLLLQGGF